MRLTYLRLVNFRNHIDSTFDIGDNKMVVILGPNYGGKSGGGQGISMLFGPSTDGLDPIGRGFVTKIRRGQNKAIITGDVQGEVHKVRRVVTLNTNATGRDEKTISLDDPNWEPIAFDNKLAGIRSAVSVALNTDMFLLNMDEAKQKGLLSSFVLPSSYDFPADKIAGAQKYLGDVIDFRGEPLIAIDKAYKLLYKARTAANAAVSDFSMPDEIQAPAIDSAGLNEQLRQARERRRAINAERDEALKKTNDANVERAKLDTKLQSLRAKRREDEIRLQAVQAKILDEERIRGFQAIIKQKPRLDEIQKTRAAISISIAAAETSIDRMEQLNQAEDSSCPTCDAPIDKDKLGSIIAELRAELAAAKRGDVELVREQSKIGDLDGAIKALKDHEEALSDKKAIQSKMAETDKEIKKVSDNLAKQPQPVDTAPFTTKLQEVDQELERLQVALRPAIVAEERVGEITRKTAELERLKAKAEELDVLVKYFDKDGIKAKLLAEHIDQFTANVNLVLDAWGYKCSFTIEPYEFLVTNTLGVTSPVKELSGSEKLMFSIAMQCAVSKEADFGIVVCDRMDTFLPEVREKANACLYSMLREGILDQVFLICSDRTREVPSIERAVFFTVEDGQVTRLEPVAA